MAAFDFETYELVHHGRGEYDVVAVPLPAIPPLAGEAPDPLEADAPPPAAPRRVIGRIELLANRTFRVGYGPAGETPLGRVIDPEDGRNLLSAYRRARILCSVVEGHGKTDVLYLSLEAVFRGFR